MRASFYCILRCHVDLNFELIPFQNTIVFYTIDDIDLRQKVWWIYNCVQINAMNIIKNANTFHTNRRKLKSCTVLDCNIIYWSIWLKIKRNGIIFQENGETKHEIAFSQPFSWVSQLQFKQKRFIVDWLSNVTVHNNEIEDEFAPLDLVYVYVWEKAFSCICCSCDKIMIEVHIYFYFIRHSV